ncbi:Alpha/Beta hydrolase protein [Xylogone sp. PMI_703]|nr:Alpha/Beta hydrolase protein [Xylogone sp. PMI_703]
MIDHVLGRPSLQFRKIQVLAVVSFWSFYLFKGNKHGPPTIRKLSRSLSRFLTPWQTLVITLLYLYIARNLGKLLGLECPEPLANLYTRSYFRATWVTTALDAGFWTAMRIKRRWLRDLCSMVFTFYYLIAAEQADEKVRRVRGVLTVDHLRVSWNKGTTPYLSFVSKLLRPRLMKYPPRQIRIPRPPNSDYTEPVHAWLYFDGPLAALKDHTKVVLDVPGGGFVAMGPRTNDDKLFAWAGKTGLPVLSLDYKKAPEFPFPYALNECYDVYCTIVTSRGRCLGMSGEVVPKIVITGDSAGGNLATGLTLMVAETHTSTRKGPGQRPLPMPEGLVLIYPGLDMNIVNWMSDEHVALIEDRRMQKTNQNIVRRKSLQYIHLAGTPFPSDDEGGERLKMTSMRGGSRGASQPNGRILPFTELTETPAEETPAEETPTQETPTQETPTQETPRPRHQSPRSQSSHRPEQLRTRLAMTSMISYFNDRILSPEMMRAMIILYVGPHNRPDFSRDYLLSPILAPDNLLALLPKVYLLTGERDPLVDDTVIFAGRLRRAKAAKHEEELRHSGDVKLQREFDDRDVVEVTLIPGISHGFLQFAGIFPEGWKFIYKCGRWIDSIFAASDEREREAAMFRRAPSPSPHHRRYRTESSGDEDMGLEMSMTRGRGRVIESRAKREETRRRKEKLLREQLIAQENKVKLARSQTSKKRQKSLVGLASETDLLGRRMLGLTGPLTGAGQDED